MKLLLIVLLATLAAAVYARPTFDEAKSMEEVNAHYGELKHQDNRHDKCRLIGYFLERDCGVRYPTWEHGAFDVNWKRHDANCQEFERWYKHDYNCLGLNPFDTRTIYDDGLYFHGGK